LKQSANKESHHFPRPLQWQKINLDMFRHGGKKKKMATSKKESRTLRLLPGGCERTLLYSILEIRFILTIKAH